MTVRDEIQVSFEYNIAEKAQYIAASNAIYEYEEKIRKEKRLKQEAIERRQEKERIRKAKISKTKYTLKSILRNVRRGLNTLFQKVLPVVCFMLIEASFLVRESGVEGLAQDGFNKNVEEIYTTSSMVGALCLIIIAVIAFMRMIKGNGFLFTVWDLVVEALKALGIWIMILVLVYGIYFFTSEIWIEEEVHNEEEYKQDEAIEEISLEVKTQSKYQMGDYIDTTFTICVEESYIYVEPTDGSHMYIALEGYQFVTTGMEYIDEDGELWYEFYLDSDKVLTSWVREKDIIFK